MPAAKKASTNNNVIEVVLPTSDPKKHSVRFETEERPVDLTNLYLGMSGYKKLGSPAQIKVTIEAHTPES